MPNDGDASQSRAAAVAVGMDLAAVGISWVPMAGAPVAALLQGVTNRQLRRRIRLLEQVVKDLGGRVEVLEKLMADDEGDAELVEDAVRYADHCRSEEGLRLMGRIVAFGVSSGIESGMGKAHLLLDAVGQLQPEHLTLVREFAMLRYVSQHPDRWSPGHRERGRQSLAYFLPALTDLIDPLLGGLETAGLIRRSDPEQQAFTRFSNRRDAQWSFTTFGMEVAKYLGPGDGSTSEGSDRSTLPDSQAPQ